MFAGGCFWGVQTTFRADQGRGEDVGGLLGRDGRDGELQGGVERDDASMRRAVKVVFDPARISYGTLLRVFFSVVHDPTQLNRQGPDVGTSYRSVIFYTTPEQEKIAKAYIAQLDAAKAFPRKIVTAGGAAGGVLRRGGLSPGLCGEESGQSVYPGVRYAEGACAAGAVSGAVSGVQEEVVSSLVASCSGWRGSRGARYSCGQSGGEVCA